MSGATVDAARDLAQLGWPVMPIKPRSKEPLTRHGFKDASTDERTILHWFERWPDANLAVATGSPGPDVLDIDRPDQAMAVLRRLEHMHAPTSATVRGRHLFFAGTQQGTITLGFGELRGRGSYVVVPPSIHPVGKEYVWLDAPRARALPAFPHQLLPERAVTAGVGDLDAAELIPHGQRHDALKDAAVRFLRGGITDVNLLEQLIGTFFQSRCDPTPPPRKGEFRKIAEWAALTRIADRERQRQDEPELEPAPEPEKNGTKKAKGKASKEKAKTGLEHPPRHDAPLAEHRAYVKTAAGLPEPVNVANVRRHGRRPIDELDIMLSNEQAIRFSRQDHITTRGWWARTVTSCTDGIADPISLGDWEATKVFRSLCIVAGAPMAERTEADDIGDAIEDLLGLAEVLTGHDLTTPDGRFDLIARCRARPGWDPRRPRDDTQPAVIVDPQGARYLRAGEVRDWFNARGFGLGAAAVPGRMHMIAAEQVGLNGREPPHPEGGKRRTNRMLVYRLPGGE